jgi:hypothetical protein
MENVLLEKKLEAIAGVDRFLSTNVIANPVFFKGQTYRNLYRNRNTLLVKLKM